MYFTFDPDEGLLDANVVLVDKRGNHKKESKFFVRIANNTRSIKDESERQRFMLARWKSEDA